MSEWTKEPPTEPGWYWFRHMKGSMHEVVMVSQFHSGLRVFGPAHDWISIDMLHGEWWPVPIEPPEE